MKTKWFLRAFALVALTVGAAACTDPKGTDSSTSVVDKVTLDAETNGVINFTAEGNWRVRVTGADWLMFVPDGADLTKKPTQIGSDWCWYTPGTIEVPAVKLDTTTDSLGTATGAIAMKYFVGIQGLNTTDSDVAVIELIMNGKTKSVLEVTRRPAEPVLEWDMVQKSMAIGDEFEFDFSSPVDWQIITRDRQNVGNCPWLRMYITNTNPAVGPVDGLNGLASTNSKAPQPYKVKFVVTEYGNNFENDYAEIQFVGRENIGGELVNEEWVGGVMRDIPGSNTTLFRITREASYTEPQYVYTQSSNTITQINKVEFKYNATGNRVDAIQIGYAARYNWGYVADNGGKNAGISYEERINSQTGAVIPFTGNAGDPVYSFWYFNIDDIASALSADAAITFAELDADGLPTDNRVNVPVVYAGIPNDQVSIAPARLKSQGISFTKDGSIIQGGMTTPNTSDKATVMARDMNYKVFVTQVDMGSFTSEDITDDSWVTIVDDGNGGVTISAEENTGAAREAYVVILPPAYNTNPDLDNFEKFADYYSKKMYILVKQQTGETVASAEPFIGWGSSSTPATSGWSQNFTGVLGGPATGAQMPNDASAIWLYEFTNANINGILTLMPFAGIGSSSSWGFVKLKGYGGGPTFTDATVAPGDVFAIDGEDVIQGKGAKVSNIGTTTGIRSMIVYFFKTDYRTDDPNTTEIEHIDLETQKADAAIVLVQKP